MTHTFARLEISEAAYDEIRGKLEAAGYDCVSATGIIDMQGIGLCKNHQAENRLHREKLDVRIIPHPEPKTPWEAYKVWADREILEGR